MNKQMLLDTFGELLINEVRDQVIDQLGWTINNESNSLSTKKLHPLLDAFTNANKDVLRQFVIQAIDSTLHHTLFTFEQYNEEFDIIANPESNKPVSLTKLSDGLCGELYSEDGWIKKYSKYQSSYD
jgi:hypothetical protein